MKNILDDLLDLDLFGLIETTDKDAEYKSALNKVVECESKLLEMHPSCKEIFDEFQSADIDLHNISVRREFCKGFRIGAQLALEMIKPII